MQTFGIQSFQVPINTKTGKRKTLNNQKWIKQQLFKEECIKKNVVFNGIECPQHKDVLSGR